MLTIPWKIFVILSMRLTKYHPIYKGIQLVISFFVLYFCAKLIASGQAFLPFFSFFAVVLSISILVKPNIAILIYIVGISLTQLAPISGRLFGMPGLSMINIMCGIVVMMFFLHVKSPVRFDNTFKRRLILFWIVIIGSITFSAMHISDIKIFMPEVTTYSYFRDSLVRPFIAWMGFLLIIYIVRTNEDFLRLLRYIFISIIVSSVLILGTNLYFFSRGYSYVAVRSLSGDFIGIHANDYGVMFALAIPMILGAMSLNILSREDKVLGTIAGIGASLTVLFSYSRACYVVALLSLLLFSTLKVKKYMIILIPLIILAPWITPDSVKDRIQYGFREKGYYQRNKADYISAGRVSMWSALLSEFTDNEKQVFVGNGRHSIYRSKARKLGIIEVGHPHNAYLEVLFDTGVLGMIIFALFYGYLFRSLLSDCNLSKSTQYEKFYFGGLIMFISYLILCIAGRSLFPGIRFVYFWLLLGLLFAFSKIRSSA